jgi:hypothetical protein
MTEKTSKQVGSGFSFEELREQVKQQREASAEAATDQFAERCAALARDGDVTELLTLLRRPSIARSRARDFALISAAVRKLRGDLPRLAEAVFGEAVAFAFILWLRYQQNLEQRFAEHPCFQDGPPALPNDAASEELVLRIERITRFIVELLAAEARIRHVRQIEGKSHRRNGSVRGTKRKGSPMAGDRSKASGGASPPVNGRLRDSQGRYPFT